MRPIDADAMRENIERIKQNVEEWVNQTECDITKALVRISLYEEFIDLIDNAPTVTFSLIFDNITEEDIEKFKIIWQRANSKGLLVINEERREDVQNGES